MNIRLINPFMSGGTKTPYKLKRTCIFQLLDCVFEYEFLLLFGMKMLKGKIVNKLND